MLKRITAAHKIAIKVDPVIAVKNNCLGGGTVYTAVLEAVPERVASSNLAQGTKFRHTVSLNN